MNETERFMRLPAKELESYLVASYYWMQHKTTLDGCGNPAFFLTFGMHRENLELTALHLVMQLPRRRGQVPLYTRAALVIDGLELPVPEGHWVSDLVDGRCDYTMLPLADAASIGLLRRASAATQVRLTVEQRRGDAVMRILSSEEIRALRDVISAYEHTTRMAWE